MSGRLRHVCIATATAAVLAVVSLAAQFGDFNEAFSGELWAVRHEITPGGGANPAGVAYLNGTLFVADSANRTVTAYNSAGHPGAQWNLADSPVFDLVPNQLAAVVVDIDGTDPSVPNAILISDEQSNRVAAFDAAGGYLFTMRLERPSPEVPSSLSIGELAMSPGAAFDLTTGSLTLSGSFTAAWVEQATTGQLDSGALVFQGSPTLTPFPLVDSEFHAAPTTILRGTEAPVSPAPQGFFGVAFDTVGNLYALDAVTERLHVYGPDLSYLFTFGTPVADGTTAEFQEPWGMAFWPDATGTGGRLFINDTYNNRILIYRPVDGPDPDGVVDALQLESVIKNFVAPDPELFSIALDPSNGVIAVTDFAMPRVVVLQQAQLATFDFQVLDSSDGVLDSVCTGAQYKVRFSLTVPAGLAAVTGVEPQLAIDGLPMSPDIPSAPLTLSAGQVVTYTYTLTAPDEAGADIQVIAGATADTDDILMRSEVISLSDCAGEVDQSTITATPSTPPQVSGWTPVFAGETFFVTLAAQDDEGIVSIEYQLEGANETGDEPESVTFDGVQSNAEFDVPIPNAGRTTLRYRVRDGNMIWSGWQSLDLRLVEVIDRQNNENTDANFAVGDPIGSGFTFCATDLPPGITIDASTGQIAGILGYDAAGVYTVVVTETLGADCVPGPAPSSSVSFTWTVLNINQRPVIDQPVAPATSEGEAYSLQITGYDPDGDAAFFTIHGRSVPLGYDLPPSITIDPVTGLISGTFPTNAEREYVITVGLSECAISTPANQLPNPPCTVDVPGERLATLVSFALQVIDVNLAPLAINPGSQSNTEGDVVTLPIVASDPDLDTLTYTADGLPQGLSIDANTGVISGTLSNASAGSHAVTIEVSDGIADPAPMITFNWTVADRVNSAPTIVSPDRTNIEGEPVIVAMVASDLDGDPLTYTILGLPTGLSMNAAGLVTGTLGFDEAGDYPVTLTVSDGTATTTANFVWHVLNLNHRPVLVGVNQLSVEGQTVAFHVDATDPDGDDLTYSMNGLPAGFSIDPDTGIISGTFGYDSAGVYTVNVGVNDGVFDGALAELATFTWTVNDTNRPPTVNNPGPQSNAENDSVSVPITASDLDGNALTYSAIGLPPGLSIDPDTGLITGTLTYNSAGIHTVIVSVSDGLAVPAPSVTFVWTVSNVNSPPTVTSADRTNAEGDVLLNSSVVTATDPDLLDVLTYSATGLPPGLTMVALTGKVSGTLGYNAEGSYPVTVTVTDASGAPATTTFLWTVTNTNRAPIALPDSGSVLQGASTTIAVLANDSDPDGTTPTLQSVGAASSGTATPNADGTITYTAPAAFLGTATFSYTITDGSLTATALVSVVVTRANIPPDAVNDTVTAYGIAPATIAVLANDVDTDGGTLTVTSHTLPLAGTLVRVGNIFTYTAPAGFFGATSFSYTISDGQGGSDTATVSITVVRPVVACVIADFREITYFKGERVITSSDAGIRTRNGIAGPFNPASWPYSPTASATSTTATKSRGTLFRVYGFKNSELGHLVPNADNPAITYPVLLDPMIADAYYIDLGRPARVSVCPEQLHNYALDTLNLPGDMPDTVMLPVAQRNVPGVMLSHNTQIVKLPARIKTEMASLGLSPTNKGLIDFVGYQLQGYGSAAFKEFVDVQFSWVEDSATDRAVHFAKGFHTAMTADLEGSVSCDYLDSAAGDDAMRLRDFWGLNRRSGVTYAAWQACGSREPAANQKKRANYVVPFNAVQILPTVNVNVDSLRMFYGEIRPVIENRAPNAVNDAISTGRGTTAYIAVLANDSDPDGDVLTVTAVTAPSKGSASIQPNGAIKYVAPTALTAPTTTTFTYTVSDGRGGTDTATVTVTLTVPNRAPIAVNDSVSVAKGASKVISVLANDSDPDGNPLTVSIVTAPAKGTAVVNPNGTITYTASSNFTGTTTFTYKVSDGKGGTATATVTVSVTTSSNGGNHDDDCGDRNHNHERDDDNRDRDHRRGDHDRCRHR